MKNNRLQITDFLQGVSRFYIIKRFVCQSINPTKNPKNEGQKVDYNGVFRYILD